MKFKHILLPKGNMRNDAGLWRKQYRSSGKLNMRGLIHLCVISEIKLDVFHYDNYIAFNYSTSVFN